jgi:nucleoside-diphosphate-sugar epimerase
VASDNCTVGHVADRVKDALQDVLKRTIAVEIKHIEDFRNYKVAIGRAKTVLGFEPVHRVEDIVRDLYDHREQYRDLNGDEYYNIRVFKKLQ